MFCVPGADDVEKLKPVLADVEKLKPVLADVEKLKPVLADEAVPVDVPKLETEKGPDEAAVVV